LAEEIAVMRELPARRMESAKRERVKVDSGSLIHVERNAYSVNSRLIGALVEARSYLDHVEVWYGQLKIEDLPRLRGRGKHRIDYRHIIEWLVRKPGAFENYRYQEDLFPTSRFRMAYDALKETTPSRCSKEYVKILKLAAEAGEVQVDEALGELLAACNRCDACPARAAAAGLPPSAVRTKLRHGPGTNELPPAPQSVGCSPNTRSAPRVSGCPNPPSPAPVWPIPFGAPATPASRPSLRPAWLAGPHSAV